jgi:hypothetical protein
MIKPGRNQAVYTHWFQIQRISCQSKPKRRKTDHKKTRGVVSWQVNIVYPIYTPPTRSTNQ